MGRSCRLAAATRRAASSGVMPSGSVAPRPVAVGDRQDRAVVGQAWWRVATVSALAGGGGQPLEPLRPHDDVAVDDHDVAPGRGREGVVAGAHEAAVVVVAQHHDVVGAAPPAASASRSTRRRSMPASSTTSTAIAGGGVGDDRLQARTASS